MDYSFVINEIINPINIPIMNKTKKELLKFFLERLELWDLFSDELRRFHTLFGAPEWSCVDNDLKFLVGSIDLMELEPKDFRVLCGLEDKEYLSRLMENEDLGSFTFAFAVADLCVYAGLKDEDERVFNTIPSPASIMDIVQKVYDVANA